MAATFDLQTHRAAMRQQGWWQDRTFDDLLKGAVDQFPDKPAIRAYRSDAGFDAPVGSLTFAELEAAVAKAAGAFRALGIGSGDVVGVQLPNWWEFEVSILALNRIGAVPNPLMHIFRERELRFMLGFAEAKAIVIPSTFRGHDFLTMMAGLRADLPALRHVIVVDCEGPDSFDRLIMNADAAPIPAGQGTPVAPDEMSVLMYTSGTTGEPKGVMHCANTMHACVTALGNRFGLRSEDVHIGATPFGHMTGYTAVMVQALKYGSTTILMDVWDPRAGVQIMQREGVTHMAASTAFLSDICAQIRAGATPPRLRTFLCGGAQIPPAVIEEARALMGIGVSSLWGMTEGLAGSLTEPERAAEKSASTDGRTVEGVELLVADENLNPLPTGKTGRLYFRGSQQFIGYFKRPGLCGREPEGWFDTGDLAYMDAEGYIRIDGRTKDIIIRGGENVPVVEIEAVLYRHPRIADAAVVGYPDPRLGERGCAVLTLREGTTFTMTELCDWMAQNGVARQYWPEAVEVIEVMPRTPNGKIKKPDLRPLAAKHSAAN
ncbi:AMP-binding protein [Pontitalea aquivivens]|uniref:AMP-binding protein n=1 Tax=Pontitalea aquivivens TaxID=3388663 RepID=UPI003970E028